MRTIYSALIVLSTVFSEPCAGKHQGRYPQPPFALWRARGCWTSWKSGFTDADAERRVVTLGPTWLRMDIHRPVDAPAMALIYNLDGSTNVNAFGSRTAETKLTRDGE